MPVMVGKKGLESFLLTKCFSAALTGLVGRRLQLPQAHTHAWSVVRSNTQDSLRGSRGCLPACLPGLPSGLCLCLCSAPPRVRFQAGRK